MCSHLIPQPLCLQLDQVRVCVFGVMSLWKVLLFFLPLYTCTESLERVSEEQDLTCGQGIIDCEVKPGACIGDDEYVYVSSLDASVVLCKKQEKSWSLCLKILLNVTVRDAVGQSDVELVGEASGNEEAEEPTEASPSSVHHEDDDKTTTATVCVSYTNPSLSESKILRFSFLSSAFDGGTTLQVWMSLVAVIREADLGSPVLVYSLYTNSTKQVTIPTPSKEEVCSKELDVVFCKDGPQLRRKTDPVTGAIKLYVADADKERFQQFQACQKLEKEGDCLKVEWNDARQDFEISLSSVAPCLCFEIWGDFPRKVYCPFSNETVISDSNVSLSVSATEIHESTERDIAIIWSLTAPCRLETEPWLCRKGSGPGNSCHQIKTTRHGHKLQNNRWIKTNSGHWQLQGEFLKVERHSLLCVQVKVRGMDRYLGPVCPFEVKRTHWRFLLLLVCVVLLCLSVLGALAVQGALKSWVFRWLKVHDMNGVEVLLVYPPDTDPSVTELLCRLSSSLSTLGFNVSLDLWSRSELNSLGPVPWLHSRLDKVQVCGGRAVLVLTPTACERAKKWVCRGDIGNCKQKEVKDTVSNMGNCGVNAGFKSSTCSDVFNATLSCILADYLGRAGKRFMLVQLEAQPPGTHAPAGTFPEFFQGLPLFNLPSQSVGFLMELTHGTHTGQGMVRRWMRSRALRAAAWALSEGLCGLKGSTGHESETEDAMEGVPLQQNQTTLQTHSNRYSKTHTISWI